MIKLARCLQREFDQPVNTIELVAGSRIDGLWPGQHAERDQPSFFASRMSQEAGFGRLLSALGKALSATGPHDGEPLYLAIELEPGPLYLLRDWATLRRLVHEIRCAPDLEQHQHMVCVNLDVAHWRVAKIDPDAVLASGQVCERIVHAHLAGHHANAHFGDCPLGTHVGPEIDATTLRWVRTLRRIAAARRGADFPGLYVSLEYEAALNAQLVRASMDELLRLL